MQQKNALIIFIKNPIKGKAKTRLAKTVGEDQALAIYLKLLAHTRQLVMTMDCDKYLFYSDFVDEKDAWDNGIFNKKVQSPNVDLGEKMNKAFEFIFSKKYEKAVIIGSDCWELKMEHLTAAFEGLENNDFVLGPAKDGGYYLLGMKNLYPEIFANKKWSTASVLEDTIKSIKYLQKTYCLLSVLSDVDHYEDLPAELKML